MNDSNTYGIVGKGEAFTEEKLKKMLAQMTEPPPTTIAYYSKHLKPDDAYKCDMRKMGFNPFIGMPPCDIVVFVGKNVADHMIARGHEIQNYKGDENDSANSTPADS